MDISVNRFFWDPMANMTMTCGTQIICHRKNTVHEEWHHLASVNKLKHCFTAMANKLKLLVLPAPFTT